MTGRTNISGIKCSYGGKGAMGLQGKRTAANKASKREHTRARTPARSARIRLAPMTRKAWLSLPAIVRYWLPWEQARRVDYIEPHEQARMSKAHQQQKRRKA